MKIKSLQDHPALKTVAAARNQLKEAQEFFDLSLHQAREAGYSLREIEKVAGISNVTVLNKSRRAEKRKQVKVNG